MDDHAYGSTTALLSHSRDEDKPGTSGPVGSTLPPAAAPQSGGLVLILELVDQRYGLPVENVVCIVEMVAIRKLPAALPFITGVIDFHGEVIPVIDMRQRFGQPARPCTLHTPIVVSQLDGRLVGLIVDAVSGVAVVPPEQIAPLGRILGEQLLPQARYLSAVARTREGLLPLLHPAALLSADESQELARASRQRGSRKQKSYVSQE